MAISFSIIVPIYNKAKYLKDCIDSILAQDYSDFEIITINDGSTDDSLNILNSYTDSRLKIVSVRNGGVSNARNIGIEKASKEYITFVDGDDRLRIDYLSSFSKDIQSSDSDVIIGGLTKIMPDGVCRVVCSALPAGPIKKKDFLGSYIPQMFSNEGIFGYVAAKFVRRSLLIDKKLMFNPALKLAEDLEFWSRVYQKAESFVISDCKGYLYVQGAENSSCNFTGQFISQLMIWVNILKNYPCDKEDDRHAVFRKINGIMEAHFLELSDLTLKSIESNLHILDEYKEGYSFDLNANTCSFLQRRIVKANKYAIWIYLNSRNLYHRLRQW